MFLNGTRHPESPKYLEDLADWELFLLFSELESNLLVLMRLYKDDPMYWVEKLAARRTRKCSFLSSQGQEFAEGCRLDKALSSVSSSNLYESQVYEALGVFGSLDMVAEERLAVARQLPQLL